MHFDPRVHAFCHKRAARSDSAVGLASGRRWPLTSLCHFSPPQDERTRHNRPTHSTVSSIKSLIDVLVLCHFDDSMLICHPRISEKLKDMGRRRRRRRRRRYLTAWEGNWQYNHGETLQREDFFSSHFSHAADPKGWSWSGHLAREPSLTSLTWKPPWLSLCISDA